MRVTIDVSPEDMARIPKTGAVAVVANHPFGGIEGIILAALLRRVRPDVRVMANFLLTRVPELRELIIPVDPFDSDHSATRNIAPLRQTMSWLATGGALGVFPAGEVSHLGPLFQLAGLVHPRLRTALLARELAKFTDRTVVVRIGKPIPPGTSARYGTDAELADYLRLRTYVLEDRRRPAVKPIAPAGDPDAMRAEVAALAGCRLLTSGDLAVYATGAERIPNLLYEIGRQREITFREASEGTGRALDLDRFDQHYDHLFVWNHAANELVGAYRLGRTDVIVERFGASGLYTHTLFADDEELLRRIGPALELGRSFVRASYQRAYAPLLLL